MAARSRPCRGGAAFRKEAGRLPASRAERSIPTDRACPLCACLGGCRPEQASRCLLLDVGHSVGCADFCVAFRHAFTGSVCDSIACAPDSAWGTMVCRVRPRSRVCGRGGLGRRCVQCLLLPLIGSGGVPAGHPAQRVLSGNTGFLRLGISVGCKRDRFHRMPTCFS